MMLSVDMVSYSYHVISWRNFFEDLESGDPPVDEVIEMLNSEKGKADNADSEEIDPNV